jgi:hypothetical protein
VLASPAQASDKLRLMPIPEFKLHSWRSESG